MWPIFLDSKLGDGDAERGAGGRGVRGISARVCGADAGGFQRAGFGSGFVFFDRDGKPVEEQRRDGDVVLRRYSGGYRAIHVPVGFVGDQFVGDGVGGDGGAGAVG